jgi:hypothetical protein
MRILHDAPRETASDWSCYFLPIALFLRAVAAFFLDSCDSNSILVTTKVQGVSRPDQTRAKGQARVQIASLGTGIFADNNQRFVDEGEAIEL